MSLFSKNNILFFLFVIVVFFLFFSKPALAGDVSCQTPCNETVDCGNTSTKECNTCCSTTCDDEGNCDTDCWSCCPCCTEYSCIGSWTVYKASSGTGCKPMIEKGRCRSVCSRSRDGAQDGARCCSCGGCKLECEKVADCEQCGSWQKAERAGCDVTSWGLIKPQCKCKGSCIKAPSGLRHYNNPNYPTDPCNPEPGETGSIKLPVKLDWDDVEGWKDGWCSGGGHQLVATCGLPITLSPNSANTVRECINAKINSCIADKTAEEQAKSEWNMLSYCEKRYVLNRIESDCKDKYSSYQKECIQLCYDYSTTPPYYTPKTSCTSEPATHTSPECPAATAECPYPNLAYNPSEMVQYYEIKIEGEMRDVNGNAMSVYTAKLNKSEFIPPNSCFFKSNRTYTWSVRACCGSGECGPITTATFTTSPAPEPIWPYDPDWAGPDRAEPFWQPQTEDNPSPVHLEWCPVEEAKSYCLRMYKNGIPFCPTLYAALFCPAVVPPNKNLPIQSYFDFGLDVFTKETNYQWKVATCLSDLDVGYKCGSDCPPNDKVCYTLETLNSDPGCCEFSQLWKFFGRVNLSAPKLISPKDDGCVNLNHRLEWTHVPGAKSYRYEIYLMDGASSRLINEPIREEYIPVRNLWNRGILTVNKKYGWRVQPCWDEDGLNCENERWSNGGELWDFTITGAAPTGLEPNGAVDVLIPIKLSWDDMSCAASYKYKVTAPDGSTVAEGVITGLGIAPSEFSINYNSEIGHPKQNTNYSWTVRTCADTQGSVCGNSASASFTTFTLGAPQNPSPSNNGKLYTDEHYLRWDPVPGAAFYKYELNGKTNIVSSNSAFIDTATLELGTYTWSVWACIDEDCQEISPVNSTWTFELVEAEAPTGKGGIVPCGKYTDNPATPWNEREHCGIQHLFIMIFSIIDYLLWKVIPIVLVLLTLVSGVMFYFSGQLGIAEPIRQVKSLWKAAGIGLAVIFLAWTGISLILGLFGYQVGIFGEWWKISF